MCEDEWIVEEPVEQSPQEEPLVEVMVLGAEVVPHQENTHQHHRVVSLGQLVLEHDQHAARRFDHLLPQWCRRLDLSNP